MEAVVAELRKSKKYRKVCDAALARTAVTALDGGTGATAVKTAKRKLHQVFGAYWIGRGADRAEKMVKDFPADPRGPEARERCGTIMGCHASTAERAPIVARMYRDLFELVPEARSVADVCCGLNPFAVPWMPAMPGFRYRATDADGRVVGLVREFFDRLGGGFTAEAEDAVSSREPIEADLVLLLKAIPCLEQQERGAARRVLERVAAGAVAVSFPARSLGGREKGMRANYEAEWGPEFERFGYRAEKLEYPSETVYVLRRR